MRPNLLSEIISIARRVYRAIALLFFGLAVPQDFVTGLSNHMSSFQPAVATGWGRMAAHEKNPSGHPSVLQKIFLKVLARNDSKCHHKDWSVCAYGGPGRDTCGGDSGGPLAVNVNGRYTLIGTVSTGPPCSMSTEEPGVYVRVTHVLDWINRNIASGA